jgi:multidrug resistance efflux pump
MSSKKAGKGRSKPKSKGLFFPPKNKKIAEIIKIDTPDNAKSSIKEFARLIDKGAVTIDQAIKYVTTAANRAKASLNRKNLSSKERKEMKEVAKTYNDFKENLKKAKRLIGIR